MIIYKMIDCTDSSTIGYYNSKECAFKSVLETYHHENELHWEMTSIAIAISYKPAIGRGRVSKRFVLEPIELILQPQVFFKF